MENNLEVRDYFINLQQSIIADLQQFEDQEFVQDSWFSNLGEGTTAILEGGETFDRAGVGFSEVTGTRLPPSALKDRPELEGQPWQAYGVSLVIHPKNPFVPTIHMNVRQFCVNGTVTWHGGGIDLTPYYGFEEDVVHHHQTLKSVCDKYDSSLYQELKNDCDDYFYIPHRQEPRGVGGIFFDDFNRYGTDRSFEFTKDVGNSFSDIYVPIVDRRKDTEFTQEQKDFQRYRRGRYVEFNLVYDRGTFFGLQSGGRSESILMSMPPDVAWRYDWHPESGTDEAELYEKYLKVKDWI